MENLSEYITNNYGVCQQVEAGKSCACIKHGWIGTGCHSWKPYEASTWEEVRKIQNETEWEKRDAKRQDEQDRVARDCSTEQD